jgi:hypothetical protein
MSALAGEGQKIFKAALPTPDTGKAVMQNAAIKIAINDLSHIGTEKAILPGEVIIVNRIKSLKMIFDTLIILFCVNVPAVQKSNFSRAQLQVAGYHAPGRHLLKLRHLFFAHIHRMRAS